ncbi:hypothetical protein Tco_0370384 [Tanacetum coccineum]
MVRIVVDVLFYERNLKKIYLNIVLKMEFSKTLNILLNHSDEITTLLMPVEGHIVSISSPTVERLRKVLHSLTKIVVTRVLMLLFNVQPMYEDFYNEQNSCYYPNSSGFDHPQPPQDSVDCQEALDKILEELEELKRDQRIIENLVPIPSEFEGISDDTSDVLNCDNNHVNIESDLVESLINRDTSIVYSSKIDPILEEFAGELAHIAPISPEIVEANFDPNDDTSSDDDSFENIEYVDASPSYIEFVSIEEVNDVEQEEKEFDLEDIFQIQDVILREKLLNVHRLISNIESLKVNPTPDRVLKSPFSFPIPVMDSDAFFEESDTSLSHLDNSLPEFETSSDHTEETRSGSTTTHANYSLPEYDSFLFEIEPDQGRLTSVVISDNSNDLLLEIPEFESFHFDQSFLRPPPEPPDIKKCFEPEAGILMIKELKGVSKFHDFMTGILPTLPTLVSDLTFISSFVFVGSEDTIFDPGIIMFLEPVAFSMAVSCSKYCSP